MRPLPRFGALAVGLVLVVAAWGRAETDDIDTEAPADEAVSACVTRCESTHEACETKAKADADQCAAQKATCDRGCAGCRRLHGPRVVYCVQDCDRCRARFAASPCAKDPAPDDGACARALDVCLERCGP